MQWQCMVKRKNTAKMAVFFIMVDLNGIEPSTSRMRTAGPAQFVPIFSHF